MSLWGHAAATGPSLICAPDGTRSRVPSTGQLPTSTTLTVSLAGPRWAQHDDVFFAVQEVELA